MLVATAGHIDHGKTTLVRALTGVDTDRLPEEKARGISIDIGFAYRTTGLGQVVGFVDVPGHERFIHNMLAGVCGIDLALLVVAADDGVMPQTREHLQIVDLLGVRAGLAVITKTDRVPAARVAEVAHQVTLLMAGTALAGAPVLAASAVTGAGLQALGAALDQAAAQRAQQQAHGRNLRFTIDRSFSVAGSGTVVTGTVLDGEVAAGARLCLSPGGLAVRVRAVHKQGAQAQQAVAGERCALNIVGADPRQAGRGNWLVAPNAHAPADRLDAQVRLLAGEAQALRHWTQVHLHIGTAEVTARVVMPGATIAPGGTGTAQLALDRPLAAVHGDRFILRDKSAQRTLGGGVVLDPFGIAPSRHNREARAVRLHALAQHDAPGAWQCLLDSAPQGIDVEAFRRAFNLTPAAMAALLASSGAATAAGGQALAFSPGHLQALEETLLATLAGFHQRAPQAAGMDLDALCRSARPGLATRIGVAVLRAMAQRSQVDITGSLARLPAHVAAARPGDVQLWAQLEPLYVHWGLNVPQLREVAARAGLAEAALRDFLKQRALTGQMARITPQRYLPRQALAALAAHAMALAGASPGGQFTIGAYRDRTAVGRNLAIEVLEYFDRAGITHRGPDGRVMVHEDRARALAAGRG
jgi:selenocysteine-specific elongation factor